MRKQELERIQLLKQLNQLDTEKHVNNTTLENTQMITSLIKRLPSQQVARTDISIPTPYFFHVIREKVFVTDY